MIVPPEPPHLRIYAGDAAEFAILMDCARDRYRTLHGMHLSPAMEQHVADAKNLVRATRQSLASDLVATSAADDLSAMLTVTQYAEQHEITTQAVTERCRRGSLPARKTNGVWFIYPDEKEDI